MRAGVGAASGLAIATLVACSSTPVSSDAGPGDAGSDVATSDAHADAGAPACTDPTSGTTARFATDAVTLPTHASDFAFDVDGDGKAENQLGALLGALASQGFDPQSAESAAVAAGQAVLLIEQTSDDPAGQNDACAGVRWSVANATATPPKFDGSDAFTIASGTTSGELAGAIANGAIATADPASSSTFVQATLRLDLFPAGPPLDLPLVGAEIELDRTGTTVTGRIHGAIRETDVQHVFVPEIATSLNAVVAADPNSATSKQLLSIFDDGGAADASCGSTCKNLNGTCAAANDGTISDCEVATNTLMASLLAPDVELFDAQGNWHPTPGGATKDSLSVGIAITAVNATF